MTRRVKDLIPEIELNKYARWASDLNMDQLEALLTLVGEHFIRSPNPMTARREDGVYQLDLDAAVSPGDRRKVGAYNALISFHRAPSSWGLERARKAMVSSVDSVPQPKVKILSLTAGTYDAHDITNNGCIELTLEVDGRICTLNDADLPPDVAWTVYEWLVEHLGYTAR